MYTPQEHSINHPTFFNKCLLHSHPEKIAIPCRKKEVIQDPFASSIISYIHGSLPIAGTLRQNSSGFIYLDIDDRFITSIVPFFNNPAIDTPPFFTNIFNQGAHISVVAPYEQKTKFCTLPIGEVFCFDITGCFKASLLYDYENKFVWYFTIESKELEQIRTSLGLSPLANNESFYITLAFKKTFLSLKDLLTEASKQHITLDENSIMQNKLQNKKPK